jgi:CO/xanthine dehydrogenase Mo-binding subunit
VNALARETAIDELAELAGTDPVSFRERLLVNNPRLAAVMHAAIEQAGWTPGVGSTGQGFGIALDVSDGTYLAEVARVTVDANTGTVQLQHVDAAIDCGLVVNPDGARCQIEGSIVMQGTSSTLKEEIRFAGGKVLNGSFAEYRPARSLEVPSVNVVFVEDRTLPPGGIGEPAVGGVSAAVSNAIYDAVGVRVRDLPFRPDRVLGALQARATAPG